MRTIAIGIVCFIVCIVGASMLWFAADGRVDTTTTTTTTPHGSDPIAAKIPEGNKTFTIYNRSGLPEIPVPEEAPSPEDIVKFVPHGMQLFEIADPLFYSNTMPLKYRNEVDMLLKFRDDSGKLTTRSSVRGNLVAVVDKHAITLMVFKKHIAKLVECRDAGVIVIAPRLTEMKPRNDQWWTKKKMYPI